MKQLFFAYAAVLLATAPVWAGLEFQTQTSDKQGIVATTHGFVDGAKAKIVFVSGRSGPGMQKGNYMLSQDGGKNIYLVNPEEKSYMKLNLDQIATQVGQFMDMAKGFVSMKFSEPKIETLLNERGPTMHGYPTEHIKQRTAYTISTSIFGQKDTTAMSREDEIWITKSIKDPGMQIWALQRSIRTGNKEIDKIIEAEAKKLNGIPLKTISVTTTRKGNGQTDVVTAVNQITAIKKSRIEPSTFAPPQGYRDATGEVMGEIIKAGQAMQGKSEKAKPGTPQDSVNTLLKGMFGGRK